MGRASGGAGAGSERGAQGGSSPQPSEACEVLRERSNQSSSNLPTQITETWRWNDTGALQYDMTLAIRDRQDSTVISVGAEAAGVVFGGSAFLSDRGIARTFTRSNRHSGIHVGLDA